jgi:hypothetical protein
MMTIFMLSMLAKLEPTTINVFFDRLKQHNRDALADRWTRFSWFGIRWVTKTNKLAAGAEETHTNVGAVLNHIEAILISAVEPPHNRQGGRFGEEVMQYLQHRDEEALGPDLAGMVKELWKLRNSD